jgi:hypothetical protein
MGGVGREQSTRMGLLIRQIVLIGVGGKRPPQRPPQRRGERKERRVIEEKNEKDEGVDIKYLPGMKNRHSGCAGLMKIIAHMF